MICYVKCNKKKNICDNCDNKIILSQKIIYPKKNENVNNKKKQFCSNDCFYSYYLRNNYLIGPFTDNNKLY